MSSSKLIKNQTVLCFLFSIFDTKILNRTETLEMWKFYLVKNYWKFFRKQFVVFIKISLHSWPNTYSLKASFLSNLIIQFRSTKVNMYMLYIMDSKNYSFFEELVKTSHKEEKKMWILLCKNAIWRQRLTFLPFSERTFFHPVEPE